jgi:hypothetical protein
MISGQDRVNHAAQLRYQQGPTGKLLKNLYENVEETLWGVTSQN